MVNLQSNKPTVAKLDMQKFIVDILLIGIFSLIILGVIIFASKGIATRASARAAELAVEDPTNASIAWMMYDMLGNQNMVEGIMVAVYFIVLIVGLFAYIKTSKRR